MRPRQWGETQAALRAQQIVAGGLVGFAFLSGVLWGGQPDWGHHSCPFPTATGLQRALLGMRC